MLTFSATTLMKAHSKAQKHVKQKGDSVLVYINGKLRLHVWNDGNYQYIEY